MKFRQFFKKTFLFDLVWRWRKYKVYLEEKKELEEWKKKRKTHTAAGSS